MWINKNKSHNISLNNDNTKRLDKYYIFFKIQFTIDNKVQSSCYIQEKFWKLLVEAKKVCLKGTIGIVYLSKKKKKKKKKKIAWQYELLDICMYI